MTLDVAQLLAPVSTGLAAAGAPAPDGAMGDGGEFAALLADLAGVLRANPITPGASAPEALAPAPGALSPGVLSSVALPIGSGTTAAGAVQAEILGVPSLIPVVDAKGLQAHLSNDAGDVPGALAVNPMDPGAADPDAEATTVFADAASTLPDGAGLALAMAQASSPGPVLAAETQAPSSPSARPSSPPASALPAAGEAPEPVVAPVAPQAGPAVPPAPAAAPKSAATLSPDTPPGIASGPTPARTAGREPAATATVAPAPPANLTPADMAPGTAAPSPETPADAGQAFAAAPPSGSNGGAPEGTAAAVPAPPAGVIRIVGRQAPADPSAPSAEAVSTAPAPQAGPVPPETPPKALAEGSPPAAPITAAASHATTSTEATLAAQASGLATLFDSPPPRRQEAAPGRSAETRRALPAATAATPGAPPPGPADAVAQAAPVAGARLASLTPVPAGAGGEAAAQEPEIEGSPAETRTHAREAPEAAAPPPAPAASDFRPSTPAQALPARATPETVAALAVQTARKLDDGVTRFDLELNPGDLGRVDVRLEIDASGRVRAAFTFETSHSARELSRRAEDLQRSLETAGFDLSGGLSFDVAGDRSQGRSSGWSDARDGRPQPTAPERETVAEATPTPSSPLSGRGLSVRAGVDIRI